MKENKSLKKLRKSDLIKEVKKLEDRVEDLQKELHDTRMTIFEF